MGEKCCSFMQNAHSQYSKNNDGLHMAGLGHVGFRLKKWVKLASLAHNSFLQTPRVC